MKLLAIAFIIVLASFAAHAQNAAAPATATPTIVFVNQDSLLANYNYFKTVQVKLQALSQKAQTEIQTKGQAFQKEVADYQKNSANLKPAQKAATEK